MLNNIAFKITQRLSKSLILTDIDKNIITYGLEMFISTVTSATSILILSILLGNAIYSLLFFIFFYSLRIFCGGFHATTYTRCFIITNLIFVSSVLISKLISFINTLYILPVVLLFSFLVVFSLSPIQNKNHPYSKERFSKYRLIARTLSIIYFLTCILFMLFLRNKMIIIQSVMSYFWTALLMIIELIKEGGKNNVCY